MSCEKIKLIRKYPNKIREIEHPDFECFNEAFKQNGLLIGAVNDKLKKYCSKNERKKLYMTAVMSNGCALYFIPAKEQTETLILEAVKNRFQAMKFSALKDEKMFEQAIRIDPKCIAYIYCDLTGNLAAENKYDLSRAQSPGLIRLIDLAVSLDENVIRFIKKPTVEMQIKAFERNSDLIEFVDAPAPLMCLKAVSDNPDNIGKIRSGFQDNNVQILAVTKKADTIKLISEPCEEAQLEAVRAVPELIEYIERPSQSVREFIIRNYPKYAYLIKGELTSEDKKYLLEMDAENIHIFGSPESLTQDEIETAVENDPQIIRYLPHSMQSFKMCEKAVRSNAILYQFCKYKGDTLLNMALQKDKSSVRFVFANRSLYSITNKEIINIYLNDPSLITCSDNIPVKICVKILKERPDAIKYIPEKKYGSITKILPEILRFIPEIKQTPEICSNALSKDPDLIRYAVYQTFKNKINALDHNIKNWEYIRNKDDAVYRHAFEIAVNEYRKDSKNEINKLYTKIIDETIRYSGLSLTETAEIMSSNPQTAVFSYYLTDNDKAFITMWNKCSDKSFFDTKIISNHLWKQIHKAEKNDPDAERFFSDNSEEKEIRKKKEQDELKRQSEKDMLIIEPQKVTGTEIVYHAENTIRYNEPMYEPYLKPEESVIIDLFSNDK